MKIALIALIAGALAIGGCGAQTSSTDNSEGASPQTVERTVENNSVEYGRYGSDAYLDGLYDDCEAGDAQACQDLFMDAPGNSEYETFGLSQPWPGEPTNTDYGDDPRLDRLYDDCESGDSAACDDLYNESPLGSEYESFAMEQDMKEPMSYGDDAQLDSLYDKCEDGDQSACDDLYFDSPIGSDYESFADERMEF